MFVLIVGFGASCYVFAKTNSSLNSRRVMNKELSGERMSSGFLNEIGEENTAILV
jgi:hypothetical protein